MSEHDLGRAAEHGTGMRGTDPNETAARSVVPARWVRRGDTVVGTFSHRQLRWLRRRMRAFHRQLTTAGSEQRLAPVLAGRRREMLGGNGNQNQHLLAETEHAVVTALAALPDSGTEVRLADAGEVWAWLWAVLECGVTLADTVGVAWRPSGILDPGRATFRERSFSRTTDWLLDMMDELIDAAGVSVMP